MDLDEGSRSTILLFNAVFLSLSCSLLRVLSTEDKQRPFPLTDGAALLPALVSSTVAVLAKQNPKAAFLTSAQHPCNILTPEQMLIPGVITVESQNSWAILLAVTHRRHALILCHEISLPKLFFAEGFLLMSKLSSSRHVTLSG